MFWIFDFHIVLKDFFQKKLISRCDHRSFNNNALRSDQTFKVLCKFNNEAVNNLFQFYLKEENDHLACICIKACGDLLLMVVEVMYKMIGTLYECTPNFVEYLRDLC